MKAIRLAAMALLLFTAACNSGSKGNGDEDTTGINRTGVENVNGNMPDTTNSMNLGPKDTARVTQDTQPR